MNNKFKNSLMNINKYKWLLLLLGGLFVACNSDDDNTVPDDEVIVVTSGSADFSKYVSLGNS